jgi:FtsP/CotA-like multicopper oxidase with cupredoxin domain
VLTNDNRRPAGTLARDTLTLSLRAATGRWRPEGDAGPSLEVEAFGETGSALTVPAPLIRVVEGTQIMASVRNELATTLFVRGLCPRDGTGCPPLEVPPAQTREVRFTAGRAGTYHYWASPTSVPVPFTEVAGAFIVDPPGRAIEPDRIFVITEWTSLTLAQLNAVMKADDPTESFLGFQPRIAFTINGLSWPATERLTYRRGEHVNWRVINLSSQTHPMHLHGFYFSVNSLGNGTQDQTIEESRRRRVVTQIVPSSGTMTMTWRPEEEGNWLFHCHVMHHVSEARRLVPADQHNHHDQAAGMAGMILGVTVLPDPDSQSAGENPSSPTPRKLTLAIREDAGREDGVARAGFALSEGESPAASDRIATPGPPLVLRRDEPVEITLVNNLREPTAIHWHGLELESYYDGVHGWSGVGPRVAPMIEPGGTFVVRIRPRRAGTFIYHTHLHDYRQLSSGLYGPVIVTEPGDTFDPTTDHVVVLGRNGATSETSSLLQDPESVLINGERRPRLVWKAGSRHRVRFVNIAPDDIFTVSLQTSDGPATWTPLTKDGAAVPAADSIRSPARQTIAVGETYDFEYEAQDVRKTLWLEIKTPAGKWQAQAHVVIK